MNDFNLTKKSILNAIKKYMHNFKPKEGFIDWLTKEIIKYKENICK